MKISPDTFGLTKTNLVHMPNTAINSSSHQPLPENWRNSLKPYYTDVELLPASLYEKTAVGAFKSGLVGPLQLLGSHQLNLTCVILLYEVYYRLLIQIQIPSQPSHNISQKWKEVVNKYLKMYGTIHHFVLGESLSSHSGVEPPGGTIRFWSAMRGEQLPGSNWRVLWCARVEREGRVPAFHAEGPGFNPRSGQRKKKRKAGSRVITPPTSPLSRVGRYKAGSGWCM